MYLAFRLFLRSGKVEEDVFDQKLVAHHLASEERTILRLKAIPEVLDRERKLSLDVDLPGPDLALRVYLLLDGVEN